MGGRIHRGNIGANVTKSIMIQGTGSNVGKSVLVAGLARAYRNAGLSVLPFKPQNMSNNAAVTADAGEIGRAQALQALACGVEPLVDMNPVLLKPESEKGTQVIVHGKRLCTVKARDYNALKPQLLSATQDSFERLRARADLILIEGAGSPAEINLRAGDIANMGFAQTADIPVVLVGDIDRGGVIAQLVGSHVVLSKQDRNRIKAFIINKFRGDIDLFNDGLSAIIERTGWPSLGVLPWFSDASHLPSEDASDIKIKSTGGTTKIAVPQLSRIANFDDLDPLKLERDVDLVMVSAGHPLPLDAQLIILPGSKSTSADLAFVRAQGWDIDLAAHIRRGGHVLGICGGYQMLGKTISDPNGIEGTKGTIKALGYLDVHTEMTPQKTLTRVKGYSAPFNADFNGYEIHIGTTTGPDTKRGWLDINGHMHGASNANGRILGAYVHGVFTHDGFRDAFLAHLGAKHSHLNYTDKVEQTLDDLADHIAQHIDLEHLLHLAS